MPAHQSNQREKKIFERALDFGSSEERLGYVKGVCADDAALLARVQALLQAHDEASRFLPDAPSASLEETLAVHPSDEAAPGDRIGRYKLLQKIGEGGCGVVYMAEQEEPVRRRVALKVIKLGMDTKSVIARFEAERQALAMMDHPNIAKVLDAGATEMGRPYFVMELVRGVSITEYCDKNQMPTRQRLDLFVQVCHAVQSAHQKGIIHRDLKPSNILVTLNDGVPLPMVIDFGIAKATNQKLTEKTLFTNYATMIGTPAYMSPEQAEMSKLDVDTRTDIYALGVLLYELLTATTPFPTKELLSLGFGEMQRVIAEREPLRPSTRLSTMTHEERTVVAKNRSIEASALGKLFRGDLDWIVMKCLEKDRTRRYDTANGLASDIQRHLNNEAVLACPPSGAYRFQKMVRRNKLVFAAASAVTLTLIAGLSFSAWSFLRELKAHAREAEQRSKADAEKITAERHLYVANMNQAQKAWEENNIGRLRQLLVETQEYPNRGFEWYYWQRQTHLPLRTLRGHLEEVTSVAFSSDGQRIVTGSWDQTAKVWEAPSGRQLHSLRGHSLPIWCVAFSPDGQRIVTGSWDGTAKVWDAASGRELLPLQGHTRPIRSVAFSSDSQRIITGSWDQTAKVWEAASGRQLLTLGGTNGNVGSVAFSPDGQHLVTGSDDQTANVWNAANGTNLITLKGHGAEIYCVAFSSDGQWIVTGSGDNTAKVWETASGREVLTLKGHSAAIWSVAFSRDGQSIVTGSWDQTAKVWEVARGKGLLPLLGHTNTIRSMAFSSDGERIVTGGDDSTAKVWETASGRQLLTLKGHTAGIASAAFSRDGQRIVTGSDDKTANVWEAASGQALLLLKGPLDGINCVAFSADGQRIITGSADNTAKVWETGSGRELFILSGHNGGISSVAFSPDGQRIVTGSNDKTAKVWEAASGRLLRTLKKHNRRIMSVAFSPDGRQIVTGSWDQTAQVWETASGHARVPLIGHLSGIASVAFSADSQRIVTGSDDNTAKVWEAASGRELLTLSDHNGGVWSVGFSADGQRIVTGSRDRMAKVWEAASAVQVAAWQKEDNAAAERLAVLRSERVETVKRDRLHSAEDAGDVRHVTFTKWGTTLPADPSSSGGNSLAGVVGGDVGTGRLGGVILSADQSVPGFWLGHVRYEFYGEKHSFIADVHVTENNRTTPATAVITGVITQGWLRGAQLIGEYTTMPMCAIPTPGNVDGSVCYQGTLQIDGGSEQ